ncbi:MAG: glycosyl hydrolase [Sphaerochaetaceae bacterium]
MKQEKQIAYFKDFSQPPREYSPVVLWFWNGELNPDFLAWQIEEMVDKGVYGGFMHARAYLKTPYLGDAWWKAIDRCIEKGREVGFFPWLYDEYAWPSGTVGSVFEYGYQQPSKILSLGEAHMAKGLCFKEFQVGEIPTAENLLISFNQIDGSTLAFYREVYPSHVDYLNKETIRLFIEMTHEEYRKRYGKEFGKLIPGIFFDEIYNRGNPLPWTDCFAVEFSIRCGYDILPLLPLLVKEGENSDSVRADYYRVLSELYEEAFFHQISEWCERNNLCLTGHTEEELHLHPRRQGHYFNTMRHLSIPGADNHDYRYKLPRKITFCEPKYAVSVARAYEKKRAMSEAMGGAGWGCSLQEYKRGINVLGAMGINFFTLHGFYNECEHQGSQADWPASFFYQNPYWKYFRIFADYISRISYMNSLGSAVVDLALYYPIEDLYRDTVNGGPNKEGIKLNETFHKALNNLLKRQMDTDFIDRESLERAEVRNGRLCVGTQAFKALICPSIMRLDDSLVRKLVSFTNQGGNLIFYTQGGQNTVPKEFEQVANCKICDSMELPAIIGMSFQPDVQVLKGDREELYVNHRRLGGKDIYMICNGADVSREVSLLFRCHGSASLLKPEFTPVYSIHSETTDEGTLVNLFLHEDEVVYLVFGTDLPALQQDPGMMQLHDYLTLSGKWSFLPLPAEYKYHGTMPFPEETWLDIPLAHFSGSIDNQSSSLIRIQNRADQKGFCGRHLSPWEAFWITRRPGWSDDVGAKSLYFRKRFTLAEPIVRAEFSIAAIGEYTCYINGECVGTGGAEATDWSVGKFLKQGENLIAVHVRNNRPMQDVNYAEEDVLPGDRLTTLLLEGEIQGAHEVQHILSDTSWLVCRDPEEGWNLPSYSLEGRIGRCDAQVSRRQSDVPEQNLWLSAWERGRPPLQPWGNIPLRGKGVSFPQDIFYQIELPQGTVEVAVPEVSGTFMCFLDGRPVDFPEGKLYLPSGIRQQLVIKVEATDPQDGLTSNVKVRVANHEAPLGDWRAQGLLWFSGYGLYSNHLRLDKRPQYRYYLDLGDVRFYTEVYINKKKAGIRLWNPYRLDVTDFLITGDNLLEIVIANSSAVERRFMLVDEGVALAWNRYWNEDNIDREPQNMVSGLQGPVRLFMKRY